MGVGDVATWFAAAIAVIAAFVAMSNANSAKTQAAAALKQAAEAEKARKATEAQVTEARRSAVAAEDASIEARKANEFVREKDAREQITRDAEAVAEASKIRGTLANMGGLSLKLSNNGRETVHNLELESVVALDDPALTWRPNPNSRPNRTTWPTLEPGRPRTFYVDFTDESGEVYRSAGREYRFTVSFSDTSGQRWRRICEDVPERVEPNESTHGTPSAPSSALSAAEPELRFQLLRVLADRAQRREQIDVRSLPDELGLDDDTVQRCLRRLHEDHCIDAMTGSDRVQSIHGLTAHGHHVLDQSGW